MKKIISVIMALMIFGSVASAQTIGVLCYHGISENPLKYDPYCISKTEFEDDVSYFIQQGYNIIKPRNMWFAEGDKNIVLTADDGYEELYYTMFPILKKYNVCAAIYIIGSKIDKTGYLKSWQIKEMHDSGLVEFGNHTYIMHRREQSVLKAYYSDDNMLKEAFWDIQKCSDALQKITGEKTQSIAFPYGEYSEKLYNTLLGEMGYTTTFSTESGILKDKSDFQKPIKRIYRNHGHIPQDMIDAINNYK